MSRSGAGPPDAEWARALSDASTAVTIEDALAAACEALLAPLGAIGAVVGAREPDEVLSAWRVEPGDASRLLDASEEPEERGAGAPPSDPGAHRVSLPLRPADGRRCRLLVLFPPEADAPQPGDPRLEGAAALCTLLLEREANAEEARRAREARDHFLVAIHHELRTPATALMLESGLLRSGLGGTLPPRLEHSLGRLEQQVTDMMRVVRRILDFAHLETAVEMPAEDLVDPREAVVSLARHVEAAADRKGTRISLFFPRALPLLQTDADRFRRILLYLLANAVKYTQQGLVQVRVERAARTGAEGRREPLLVVRVIDNGSGIPQHELERVFEPFAQVEEGARTDSRNRGIGLGLPLARKLARSLGGDVSVESRPGRGTSAILTVPYRAAAPGG